MQTASQLHVSLMLCLSYQNQFQQEDFLNLCAGCSAGTQQGKDFPLPEAASAHGRTQELQQAQERTQGGNEILNSGQSTPSLITVIGL